MMKSAFFVDTLQSTLMARLFKYFVARHIMTKKLLVTGLSGFVGCNLRSYLTNQTHTAWTLIDTPPFDLTDAKGVGEAVSHSKPDGVIHLAAQSFVPESFRDPTGTLKTNLLGTLNLLQALKSTGFCGSFLYVSSGDVYGKVPESELPITETRHPKPRNPYGVSKVSAETLCSQWSICETDWRIIIARPFNHIGPGQSDSFLIPEIARQLCSIRRGQQDPELKLGDIDVTRDFLDVRDVISAYFALLERGESGEIYNVCSGKERLVRDIIELMFDIADTKAQIVQDTERMRKTQQRRAVGNYDKLQLATGWHPTIELKHSLKAVLEDWEQRLNS